MQEPIIVKDLVKSYALVDSAHSFDILLKKLKSVLVLDGISFSVPQGEIFGVMGNNGAGKSTLLRILGKVYSHDSGKVIVQGAISSIFEMGSFMNIYMTGREYCREYLFLMTNTKIDYDAVIEDVEDFSELGQYFDEPINTYSSGMMAKLLFSLATAFPTDVILIDEVLVVGDLYFQSKAWKRLRNLLHGGVTGVIVSHAWDSILKLCKNSILLENHKISFAGSTHKMIQRYLGDAVKKVTSEEILLADETGLIGRTYRAVSGESFKFEFDIEVATPPEDGELAVYYYVEQFVMGVGWNVAFILNQTVFVTKPGRYTVVVEIPNMPLAPGEYLAGVELVVPLKKGEQTFSKIFARLSWLTGNSIPLCIEGENPDKVVLNGGFSWEVPHTM